MLDAINADQREEGDSYRYVVDRELFLNIGRMAGVFLVLTSSVLFDENITLRITPVILALVTSAILLCSRRLTRARYRGTPFRTFQCPALRITTRDFRAGQTVLHEGEATAVARPWPTIF